MYLEGYFNNNSYLLHVGIFTLQLEGTVRYDLQKAGKLPVAFVLYHSVWVCHVS